jgi:hypothetical protein
MRVLVACEFSGVVREAFRSRGHDAYSCDLLPAEDSSPYHIQRDIRDVLLRGTDIYTPAGYYRCVPSVWDLMIAHPPSTHLSSSGARWFRDKREQQAEAIAFVRLLMAAPIDRLAIENPVGVLSSAIRKPDQIVQPFHFGDPFRKTTCLWLKGLPPLEKTNDLGSGAQACWLEPPHRDRWKRRSRTYPGIAAAMAEQWGDVSRLTPLLNLAERGELEC